MKIIPRFTYLLMVIILITYITSLSFYFPLHGMPFSIPSLSVHMYLYIWNESLLISIPMNISLSIQPHLHFDWSVSFIQIVNNCWQACTYYHFDNCFLLVSRVIYCFFLLIVLSSLVISLLSTVLCLESFLFFVCVSFIYF